MLAAFKNVVRTGDSMSIISTSFDEQRMDVGLGELPPWGMDTYCHEFDCSNRGNSFGCARAYCHSVAIDRRRTVLSSTRPLGDSSKAAFGWDSGPGDA